LECKYLCTIPANYSFLAPLGHGDVCKAGILHCDISVGNSLIVSGCGIVIALDLSKQLDQSMHNEVRHPTHIVSIVLTYKKYYFIENQSLR
jgi:hypothetical protein